MSLHRGIKVLHPTHGQRLGGVGMPAVCTQTVESWRSLLMGATGLALLSCLLRFAGSVWAGGGYDLTAQLLLCGLGVNYSIAYRSMRGQILGLVGSKGVLPCHGDLDEIRATCEAHTARDTLHGVGERRQAGQRAETHQQLGVASEPPRVQRDGTGMTHMLEVAAAGCRPFVDRLLLLTLEPAFARGPEAADAFLTALCDCGALGGWVLVLAQFEVFGILQTVQLPLMLGLWWAYYVVKHLTKSFSNLPWDKLLLEYGALALPLGVPFIPSRLVILLLFPILVLAFKLFFSSGVVKLRSKCPKWSDLSAMCYHYETQPLPHWLSWRFHSLPPAAQRLSCFIALTVEGPVCFLVFGTASCRAVAFTAFIGLMGLISVSGNYGFFNYCTMALCFALLDDEQIGQLPGSGSVGSIFVMRRICTSILDLPAMGAIALACATVVLAVPSFSDSIRYRFAALHPMHIWASFKATTHPHQLVPEILAVACYCWAGAWILLGLSHQHMPAGTDTLVVLGTTAFVLVTAPSLTAGTAYPLFHLSVNKAYHASPVTLPPLMKSLYKVLQTFSIGSSYGMFARTTTVRGEIVLLGSVDGHDWKEYTWKFKAGDINTQPKFVRPGHMPRLDWRLSNKRMPLELTRGGIPDWFDRFIERMLEGSADVLALLGADPFATCTDRARFIKVQIYDYRFTGSRNAHEHFMPGQGESSWQEGTAWQRRFVKTVKTYKAQS